MSRQEIHAARVRMFALGIADYSRIMAQMRRDKSAAIDRGALETTVDGRESPVSELEARSADAADALEQFVTDVNKADGSVSAVESVELPSERVDRE